MINLNIDLKENVREGRLRASVPTPLKNLQILTTLIFSDYRILFLNTLLSEEVMFSPQEIHFSISQLSFCHRILYLHQLFSISVVSTWLQGKCGKRRVFFLSSSCHWQHILTWRCTWNPTVIGWILAGVKTGREIAFHFNLVLWSSEP